MLDFMRDMGFKLVCVEVVVYVRICLYRISCRGRFFETVLIELMVKDV